MRYTLGQLEMQVIADSRQVEARFQVLRGRHLLVVTQINGNVFKFNYNREASVVTLRAEMEEDNGRYISAEMCLETDSNGNAWQVFSFRSTTNRIHLIRGSRNDLKISPCVGRTSSLRQRAQSAQVVKKDTRRELNRCIIELNTIIGALATQEIEARYDRGYHSSLRALAN